MKFLLSLLAMLALSGCATYQIHSYSPQDKNTEILSNAQETISVSSTQPAFTDSGEVFCRGAGPVKVANGETFTKYVTDSLRSELENSEIFSADSTKSIIIKLTKVDFETTLGNTNWYIDGEYLFGGKSVFVSTTYNDKSSYFGETACRNMAKYFPKAVASHLNQLYRKNEFKEFANIHKTKSNDQLTSKLQDLKNALSKGLITEEEYSEKRNDVLNTY